MKTEMYGLIDEVQTSSIKTELSQVNPELMLPTEAMIAQGKQDFQTIFETFPAHITPAYDALGWGSFRSFFLEPDCHPIWGCFMGFTAHASQLSRMLTLAEAEAVKQHITLASEGRLDAVIKAMVDDPTMANFHLIHRLKAQQIMALFPSIFSVDAQTHPVQWIEQMFKNQLKTHEISLGLLSGFPPMAVVLYEKTSPVSAKTIRGIGTFDYFGTAEEDRYIQMARELFATANIDAVVDQLGKEQMSEI